MLAKAYIGYGLEKYQGFLMGIVLICFMCYVKLMTSPGRYHFCGVSQTIRQVWKG